MKKNTFIIFLFGLYILFAFSCSDLQENLYPDRYLKTLTLKKNGIIDLKMNTTQKSVMDSILILKGGGRPDAISNMQLKILTREEGADFGGYEVDKVQIIPSDAYDIAIDRDIKIEADGRYAYVPITFHPVEIYAAMKKFADDVVWLLPINLISASDTVNPNKDKILYRFDVQSPLVTWGTENMQEAEITYRSLDFPVSVGVTNSEVNAQNFTCELDVSKNEVLVSAYNAQNGTSYELLPIGSYTFDKFSFQAGEKVASANLKLTRTGLQSDRVYLLPLKLGAISTETMDKTDEIRYVIVTNPKYSIKEMSKTNWKTVFSNSNRDAPRLIDGSFETAWMIPWWVEVSYIDDYEYSFLAYHAFSKRRDMPNAVIVIDLGREVSFAGIGIGQGTLDPGDRDMKDCEFYLADTFRFTADGDLINYNTVDKGNSWKSAITCKNIPHVGGGPYWYNLSTSNLDSQISKGRYLKIRPIGSHRNDPKLCSFSELFVNEIVAVDGVALKQ